MEIELPSEQFENDPRLGLLDSCARTLGRLLNEAYDIENRRAYTEWEADVAEATKISDDWHIKSCFTRYRREAGHCDDEFARYDVMVEYIDEVRNYCKGEKFYPGDRAPVVGTVIYGNWRLEGDEIFIRDRLVCDISAHQKRILTHLIRNPRHLITASEIVAYSGGGMEKIRVPAQISKLRKRLRKHFKFSGEVIPKMNGEHETTYFLPEQTITPK